MCDSKNNKQQWDFKIQTNSHIEHSYPYIVRQNQEENTCLTNEIAGPFDTKIVSKESEKIENYHDFVIRIGNCLSIHVIGRHWYSLEGIWELPKSVWDVL